MNKLQCSTFNKYILYLDGLNSGQTELLGYLSHQLNWVPHLGVSIFGKNQVKLYKNIKSVCHL